MRLPNKHILRTIHIYESLECIKHDQNDDNDDDNNNNKYIDQVMKSNRITFVKDYNNINHKQENNGYCISIDKI